ncbi:NAD(P)H-hydrate repair Nnr-like enzyme with NAD(P)H-hydrate dehydratase domain [Isoptericola jiangsuensis]|uniref:Bifunctional NAD(P)H-hydrate repair enzyme n=1 Tax=Isoptericola jiangsuensis TaxID=548579 RepID=A0A2A9EVG8_9MICO|nr:bifunctional ADP-dependent NAD(P)H-hydrate dehydratase/NAD(P)H-hydrate epimerase [Isoptericola jiangsuensis]PFG42235.1 NAD(P)H-hydrate repair Nnr-like enzyme with NAD(P)H-hydrate dehydratase domain [Isoptericola jiangsuensis]
MIRAWSVADVRAAEEPLLAAGVPLMDRAAFALALQVLADLRARRRSARGAHVVVLAGAGNNGGDALHAGAHLVHRGVAVTAVLAADRVHEGGLAALRSAGGRVVDAAAAGRAPAAAVEAARADVVLDGLVGIGARGPLRGSAAALVTALGAAGLPTAGTDAEEGTPATHAEEAQGASAAVAREGTARPWVVAVDTPSGIGVDDGTLPGPVLHADRTVTFGAAKPGLLLPPAAHVVGEVTVVDIGLTLPGTPAVQRLAPADVAARWPVPGPQDHKYTRGVVGVVAGTATYPGAAVLTTTAAVRTGAGMVRYRGSDVVARAVLAARPEVVTAPGRVQSWVVGPGVPPAADGADDGQAARARAGLAAARGELAGLSRGPVPAVVDAGGLGLVEETCPPWFVLTPHAGELRTVLRRHGEDVHRAEIEAAPLRWARRAHDLTGATILLKGAVTVVVGTGIVHAQADAPAWLGTAGAGDVLAGILGTMLAARAADVVADPAVAGEVAASAALVHGLAAEHANPGGPVAALDVAEAVPGTVARLLDLWSS